MGQGPGHSGRARSRLRRRLARRLCADHHRSRSSALLTAVRTLSQSRTRLDAGFRHRLLPDAARRGHRLCPRPIRRRQGGADHHLRLLFGARRAAQCRPRAGNATRPSGQARENGAAESGRADDAKAGDRDPSRACRKRPRRTRGSGSCSKSRKSSKASIPTPRPMRRALSSATGRSTSWCRSTAIPSPTCPRPNST